MPKGKLLRSKDLFATTVVVLISVGVGYFLGLLIKHRDKESPLEAQNPEHKPTAQRVPVLIDWGGNAPLGIRLIKETQPTPAEIRRALRIRSGMLLAAFLAFVIATIFRWYYVTPTAHTAVSAESVAGIDFILSRPLYFSLGEKTTIQLTVSNKSNQETTNITAVVETVDIEGPYVVEMENTSRIEFGELLPGERKTREVTFLTKDILGRLQVFPEKGGLTLNTRIVSGQQVRSEAFRMRLAPVSHLKALLTIFYMSAFFWAALGLFYRESLSLSKLVSAPLLAIVGQLLLGIGANLLTDAIKAAATANLGR